MMTKLDAISEILNAAKIYNQTINDKNLLIIAGKQNNKDLSVEFFSVVQTVADSSNFLHLTGVTLNNGLSAVNFFNKALNNNLALLDFELDSNTERKLSAISYALNIRGNFKMFGNYNYNLCHPDLRTDIILGNDSCFIGFKQVGQEYIPNTVIKEDLRNNTDKTVKVLAVLSKDISDSEYSRVSYLAKGVYFEKLLKEVQKAYPDIQTNVDFATQLTPQQLNKEAEFSAQEQEIILNKKIKSLLQAIALAREESIKSADTGNYEKLVDELTDTLPNQKKCREVIAEIQCKFPFLSEKEKTYAEYEIESIKEKIEELNKKDKGNGGDKGSDSHEKTAETPEKKGLSAFFERIQQSFEKAVSGIVQSIQNAFRESKSKRQDYEEM